MDTEGKDHNNSMNNINNFRAILFFSFSFLLVTKVFSVFKMAGNKAMEETGNEIQAAGKKPWSPRGHKERWKINGAVRVHGHDKIVKTWRFCIFHHGERPVQRVWSHEKDVRL